MVKTMQYLQRSRRLLLGLGLASCGTAAAVYGYNKIPFAAKVNASTSVPRSTQYIPSANVTPLNSGWTWDFNWDKRQPVAKENLTDDEKKDESKDEVTAIRYLILVRHGQYNQEGEEDEKHTLTELGREQADLAGKKIKELGYNITRVVHSTQTRATETAQIILKHLPSNIKVEKCDFLREGAPIKPGRECDWNPDPSEFFIDGARIEAAFRRYFHRASPEQKEPSFELLVCHGNVIRYSFLRALQLPPEAWLQFSILNCSLTFIRIDKNGVVHTFGFGDAGFMPKEKRTFN